MARLLVHNFSISLDGFGAGPDQSLEHPLGRDAMLKLHGWLFAAPEFGGEHGDSVDDEVIRAGRDDAVGATVMGRNMFGPVRGPWPDESWRGWWDEDPPFHHDVFVLTHHARAPLSMAGGTTFHFVTDGLHAALDRAFDAAGGRDVRLGGGVSTLQQAMRERLVDQVNLAVVPVLLGTGERLLAEPFDYQVTRVLASDRVVHVRLEPTDERAVAPLG